MKSHGLRIAALAAWSMLGIGAAQADTQTVTVNANIIGICKFVTGQNPVVTVANTGTNIDPSLAGPATGSVGVDYHCTNGTTPTFSGPATATVTCTVGACNTLSMTPAMTYTSGGAGNGFSPAAKVLTVAGQLTQAQYQDMVAGAYSGTVLVTVTP